MADQTPLGNLDVIISADWSDLQSEVNSAVAASQTAADAIEAAFNGIDTSEAVASIGFLGGAAQAAGESLSTFGQAAQDSTSGIGSLDNATAPLAGSLSDVGAAAVSAGGDLGGFGSDASQAAGAAHEAEGGVQGLAEQFVALGEALAVTEGLKEFGQEALTAYGTVQSVTIGLTQLTGSAQQADEIITQIKELAATEPFAFPEIAPTIQKMVALGVSAEQIPGVMQAVADAAAATGNQFSQVANSFDRMTLSGTVSARSLVQLGVNTTQLGAAMGVAADQVKAAFLAMDQTDRITVLEAAMGKFAGAAEAQAQGIAGQWQIFENTFEEVMVGVGEALAPVVGEILSFGKSVLTTVQGAIEVFNELPEPVKEVAVAAGLLLAAIVPVTAAVSALGFAWIGIESAGTALTGIMSALGLAGEEAAAGETAAAVAAGGLATGVEASGAAAVTAEAGVGALGISLGGLAAVIAGPVVAALLVTQSNLETLKEKWDEVTNEMLTHSIVQALNTGDATAQIAAMGLSMDTLKGKILNAGVAGDTLGNQLSQSMSLPLVALGNLGIGIDKVGTALKGIQIDGIPVFTMLANSPDFATFQNNIIALGGNLGLIMTKLNALTPAIQGYSTNLGITVTTQASVDKGLQDLTIHQEALNTVVTQAQGVMQSARTAMQATGQTTEQAALSQQVYNDAVANYNKAVTAATPTAKALKDSIDGVIQAMEQAQEKAQSSISVFQDLATAHSGDADAVGLLAASYTKAESAAKAAGIAFASAEGEAAKQKVAFDQASASLQADQGALGGLIIKYYALVAAGDDTTEIQERISLSLKDVQSEATKTGGTYHNATAELIALNVAGQNAMSNLTGEAAVWQGLAGTVGKTATQMVEMNTAFAAVQKDAAAVGLAVQQVGQSLVFTVANAATATPAMQALAQQMTDSTSAGVDWVNINGKLVATMQAVTDATVKQATADGVLVQAGDQVRSVQGFLNQDFGAGVVVLSGLTQATNAHATALRNDAQAAAQAKQAQIDLGSTYQTVTSSATNFTNAAKNQVAALENDVGAFTSLHSAGVTSLADQIALSNAFKASVTAGQALGITITSTGASSKSTSPFVQALVTQLNNQIHAMGQLTTATPPATTATTAFGAAASTAASNLAKLPQQASLTAQGITDLTTKTVSLTQQVTDANGVTQELTTTIQGAGVGATTLSQKIGTAGETITTATTDTDNLDTALQNFSSEAPGVVSAASSITTAFNSLATAADNAASAEDKAFGAGGTGGAGFSLGGDNILSGSLGFKGGGSGQSLGSYNPTQVQQVINGAVTTGGWSPPPDPNPGRDHLVDNASTVGPDTNPYSWVANATPTPAAAAASASAPAAATPLGNQPVTPVATVPAAVDNTAATQANTAATAANTGATAAATPATAADTAATQANAAATTPNTAATVANTAATQASTAAATAAAPALASVATSAANTSAALASTATASGNVTTDLGVLDTAVTQLARDEGTLDQATAQLAQDTGALDQSVQGVTKDLGSQGQGLDGAIQQVTTDFGTSSAGLDGAIQAVTKDLGTNSAGLDGAIQAVTKDLGSSSAGLDGAIQGVTKDLGSSSSGLDGAVQALTTDGGNLDKAFQALVTDAGNLDQALQNLVSAIGNATPSGGSGATGSGSPGFNFTTYGATPGGPSTGATGPGFSIGSQPGAPNVYGIGAKPGTSPIGSPPAETGTWTWDGFKWVQVGGATASGASTGSGSPQGVYETSGSNINGGAITTTSTAPTGVGASAPASGESMTGGITETQFSGAFTPDFWALTTGITGSTNAATAASTALGGLGEGATSLASSFQALTQAQINALAETGNSGTPTPAIDPNAIVSGLTEAQLEQDYPQIAAMNYGNPDLYGNYPITNAPSSLTPTSPNITLTVQVNAGTVVGSNAAQQLVNLVLPQMVAQLRQAGVKI